LFSPVFLASHHSVRESGYTPSGDGGVKTSLDFCGPSGAPRWVPRVGRPLGSPPLAGEEGGQPVLAFADVVYVVLPNPMASNPCETASDGVLL
jgi:hypothetical protein